MERLISTSALQFKGSGLYATDYAKKSGSEAAHGKKIGAGQAHPQSRAHHSCHTRHSFNHKVEGHSHPARLTLRHAAVYASRLLISLNGPSKLPACRRKKGRRPLQRAPEINYPDLGPVRTRTAPQSAPGASCWRRTGCSG